MHLENLLAIVTENFFRLLILSSLKC